MKRTLFAALALAATAPVFAAEVGVSIGFSQPGVYGRIDIGQFPQPQVIVQQPVVIERPRVVGPPPQPVYMWVPYEHRKNWSAHCREYNACGVPVYFVRHDWYDREVRSHGEHRGEMRHDERRDNRRDDDHHDHGKGRGHD